KLYLQIRKRILLEMYCTAVNRCSRSRVRRAARNSTTLPPMIISLSACYGNKSFESVNRIVFDISTRKEFGKEGVILGMKNNHNRNCLAFKVKTTSNRVIRIRPARGI